MKLTAVPTLPLVGAVLNVTTSAVPVIAIDVDAEAILALVSVAFTLTVKLPFVA